MSSFCLLFLLWLVNLFCIFVPSSETYRPKLFNPSVAGQAENAPFYYYTLPSFMGDTGDVLKKAGEDENITEWASFLKNTSEKTIREILYEGYYYQIEGFFKGEVSEKELLENNEALDKIKKENPAALDYMIFAKKCEYYLKPNSNEVDTYTWNEKPKDEAVIAAEAAEKEGHLDELMKTAKARYAKINEPFFKMRYAYQIVTLGRYMTKNKENCSVLYDKYVAPVKFPSILKSWAMLHKAHALQGIEADYYYAMVFDQCAAKRSRAFQLYTHSNTDSVAMLAKNDKEKAAVWAIASLNEGKNLDGLKKVYQYHPNAKNLNLLLVNEISKVEDWLLTEPFTKFQRDAYDYVQDTSYDVEVMKLQDKAYFVSLQSWVQKVISEQKVQNLALWNLANAHLYYIDKQWIKAQEALNVAENEKGINDDLRQQISVTRLLAFALDNGKITPMIEQKIAKSLINLQRFEVHVTRKGYNPVAEDGYGYPDERSALDNILVALANRYEQQGDLVKAGLLLSRSNHLQRSCQKSLNRYGGYYDDYFFYFDEFASSKDLKSVVELVNKEQKTAFEYFLTEKVDKEYYRMCDLYGTMLFREGDEAQALEAWKPIPAVYWKKGGFDYKTYLNEDPFERDFFNPHATQKGFFTKPFVVAKILNYKQLSEKEPTQTARYYYLIGNAYYNVSTFGTAWMCSRYGWSNYESLSSKKENRRSDDENYLRLQRAIDFYKKAAEASTDKSFTAYCYRIAQEADERREKMDYDSSLNQEELWDENKVKPTYTSPFQNKIKVEFSAFFDGLINDCGKLQEIEKKTRI